MISEIYNFLKTPESEKGKPFRFGKFFITAALTAAVGCNLVYGGVIAKDYFNKTAPVQTARITPAILDKRRYNAELRADCKDETERIENTRKRLLTLESRTQRAPETPESREYIPELELIRQVEGFSSTAYKCQAGVDTIGYGHVILPEEKFNAITEEEAERILEADTKIARDAITKYVRVPLTQNQHSALTSFVYNVGERRFRESTMLKKLNSGDYEGAASEFSKWNKVKKNGKKIPSQGLTSRRRIEANLFIEN